MNLDDCINTDLRDWIASQTGWTKLGLAQPDIRGLAAPTFRIRAEDRIEWTPSIVPGRIFCARFLVDVTIAGTSLAGARDLLTTTIYGYTLPTPGPSTPFKATGIYVESLPAPIYNIGALVTFQLYGFLKYFWP